MATKDKVVPTRTFFAGEKRRRVQKFFKKPSKTKQSFRDECDINNIMKRYEKDGLIAHVNRYSGQYGDFGDAPLFQDAMNKVIAAEEMFMSLPAAVRTRFKNDPGAFIAFATDEKNRDEMKRLGLLKEEAPAPVPMKVEVVNNGDLKKDD